jgi:hypothetical protein
VSRYVPGAEVAVGDCIDYTPAGWIVAYFTEYVSPLIPITGPGRIAHRSDGASMAVYDKHPVRLRTFAEATS